MRCTALSFFSFALATALVGCNGRSGDLSRTDGGTHDGGTSDGGGTGDAGDAHDSGAPGDGGGTDAGGPGDGGHGDGAVTDAGSACMSAVPALGGSVLPRCSEVTRTCMSGCETRDGGMVATCVQACAHADTTAPVMIGSGSLDCIGCLSYQQRYCADHTGCHAQTAALSCCIDAHCPGGGCMTTTCMTEYTAWSGCATTTAASCLSSATGGDFAACFPATDGGAP